MTDGEKGSLRSYTATDHVLGYTAMRTVDKGWNYGVASKWQKKAAKLYKDHGELVSGLKKAPLYEGTVHRGIKGLTDSKLQQFVPGAELKLSSLTSFTEKASVARDFASKRSGDPKARGWVMMTTKTRSGVRIPRELSAQTHDEKEVIVPRGTKYRVASVKEVGQYGREITLEEV